MHRYYFVSNDLDDVKAAEQDFYHNDFSKPQIHVLSENIPEVDKRGLPEVSSILRSDVVHGGVVGGFFGMVGALIILSVGIYLGQVTLADWMPFIFLAAVVFLFCIWEGGLFGIQVGNVEYRRFSNELKAGNHVLMVDAKDSQARGVKEICSFHPTLRDAGEGTPNSIFYIWGRKSFDTAIHSLP